MNASERVGNVAREIGVDNPSAGCILHTLAAMLESGDEATIRALANISQHISRSTLKLLDDRKVA